MSKPIILAVDDDKEVLRAIARDVRREYGEKFRVVRAESGAKALEVLREIKVSGDAVALMLVDQRMPDKTGVEMLAEARPLFPDSKRTLLTAYADTDAAITAINDVQLDYYLVKPWDPPEERLYPVLDDLLDDWLSDYRPAFEGIRVVGHRWSRESHTARDFLARNQVPFQWMDLGTDPEAQNLQALLRIETRNCPVLLFPDGTVLQKPTAQEIAEKIGLRGHAEVPLYDLVVVGAGPAGLAAAVYGASEGLKTIIVEQEATGGQAGMSSRIENYLGFPAGISGNDLARRAMTQAKRFGTEFLLTHEVVGIEDRHGVIGVTLEDQAQISAHSVLIATGVSYRRLSVPGADELTGRGVYYGAGLSESSSVEGEDIFIVGGANSAGQAAIYFSDVARKITMLIRGSSLSAGMSSYLSERILETPNISLRFNSAVDQVLGTEHLEGLVLKDTLTGEQDCVEGTALFVFIGAIPLTSWLDGAVSRDEKGFVLTGPDAMNSQAANPWSLDRDPFLLETNIPGVFAAGDVRHGSGKRVATAVGEGAAAVMSVWQYRALVGL